MNWPAFFAFFEFGGYGPYVWGSFGVTFVLLAIELWALRRRWRAAQRGSR